MKNAKRLSMVVSELTNDELGVICNLSVIVGEVGRDSAVERVLTENEITEEGVDEMIAFVERVIKSR